MAWVAGQPHTGRTLVCRRSQGWVAVSPGDEGGPHLYLINDCRGTGQFQNVLIDHAGDFWLEGEVDCFDVALGDMDPHNLASEPVMWFAVPSTTIG